METSRLRA